MHSRTTDVAPACDTNDLTDNPATASHRVRGAAAALATTVGAAAVVTTAAVAAAPAAGAATNRSVWDRVAQCESTNRWNIDTGNGFYGGLQFTAGTWRAYGGGTYAGRADHATRTEQIEVARRVLASQGPHAWPVCGPRAGLTRSTGHATSTKVPRVAGSFSGSTHRAKHASHHTAKHHQHQGKHRAGNTGGGYRVKSGDTLSGIAAAHHVAGGWHALYRANTAHLSNPNVLHVGQHLTLP